MNRRIAINLAFFLLVFGVMIYWAVGNIVTVNAIEQPYTISGEFEAASGVLPNAEVAYLGVHYGQVSAVELIPGGVEITMRIDRGSLIPVGSIARIFRKSAIGEPYIDFQPPPDYDAEADDVAYIQAGDTVPIEQTQVPLEFSEFLRLAGDLIGHIDPVQAGSLIHELALALDGRAEDLRTLISGTDTIAATFAERTEALDRLATNNTRLTTVLADHRGSLGQAITDLTALAESLRDARGDTSVLLDRGTRLLTQVADLVSDSEANINCVLGGLVPVVQAMADPARVAGTAHLLDVGPTAFDLFFSTRDEEPDGVWVRVNLLVNLQDPAIQYDPPHVLPEPRVVPECAGVTPGSTSAATPAGDFRPADVLGRRDSLPATGARLFGSLAALIALLGLAVRWVARESDA